MIDRLSRYASLAGVLFAVLVGASVVANHSYAPKASANAAKVVSYYTEHHSVASILVYRRPGVSADTGTVSPLAAKTFG